MMFSAVVGVILLIPNYVYWNACSKVEFLKIILCVIDFYIQLRRVV